MGEGRVNALKDKVQLFQTTFEKIEDALNEFTEKMFNKTLKA